MKTILFSLLLPTGLAFAQVDPEPASEPVPLEEPIAAPTPAPVAAPTPAPRPAPVAHYTEDVTTSAPITTTHGRPNPRTFGIGAGYEVPTNIQNMGVVSARFVMSDKLTLEPYLELSRTGRVQDDGTSDIEDATLRLGVGTDVRLALYTRHKTAFSVIGTARFSWEEENPDGDDNRFGTTALEIGWGLGVDYYFNKNWGFSFSVTNPLFTLAKTKQETPLDPVTDTTTYFGVVWDDLSARAMLHLYF